MITLRKSTDRGYADARDGGVGAGLLLPPGPPPRAGVRLQATLWALELLMPDGGTD